MTTIYPAIWNLIQLLFLSTPLLLADDIPLQGRVLDPHAQAIAKKGPEDQCWDEFLNSPDKPRRTSSLPPFKKWPEFSYPHS